MTSMYGRPTAAELVAAVADFLDTDVRSATDGQVSFHARVAANVLRTVERELLDQTSGEVTRHSASWALPTRQRWPPPSVQVSSTAGRATCCPAYARWCVTGSRSPTPAMTSRHEFCCVCCGDISRFAATNDAVGAGSRCDEP